MYERTLDLLDTYIIIVDLVDRFTVFFCFPFINIIPRLSPAVG